MTDGPGVFNWTRYWCPRGAKVVLDGGFLLDPSSPIGQMHDQQFVATSELPQVPVLVLLGEAGSGKFSELFASGGGSSSRSIDLGAFGTEDGLEREIRTLLSLPGGPEELRLDLDALDEALIGIPKAAEVIRTSPYAPQWFTAVVTDLARRYDCPIPVVPSSMAPP